jgi:hypothetical protein
MDALGRYWAVCPNLRAALFRDLRPGYVALAVEKPALRSAVFDHPEFKAFVAGMNDHFQAWRKAAAKSLKALKPGCHPEQVIAGLGEGLPAHYRARPLIDNDDVYQHLMDYWTETMQDDCYLIAADGWKAETYRIIERDKKGKEKDKGWACDLVPKGLVVARYFAGEQAAVDEAAAQLEAAIARLAELEDEHGGEEGALSELEKVNKAAVAARLREIEGDKEARHEAAVLKQWLSAKAEEDKQKKRLAELEEALDAKAYAKYPKLTPDFWDGEIPWCTPTDITGLNGGKYLDGTTRSITRTGLQSSAAELLPANSIVMTSRATIGECTITRIPVTTNQGFKNFVPYESVDGEFLYYLLCTQKPGFISLCGGSTFLEISKRQVENYSVRLPVSKAEQSAIAAVLSDMDAEIAAVEAKPAKARQVKQGMMQELLTGRTRLL